MALNLRTDPTDDGAIERLARRWSVSKNAAILRAVHVVDEQLDHRRRVDAVVDRVLGEDAALLERLRRV